MRYFKVLGVFAAFLVSLAVASAALAYYPTMNVYTSGNSSTISISGAQPNAPVTISYTPSGSSLSTSVTGTTDYSGAFTTMINSVTASSISATVAGQQIYANNSSGYNGSGYGNCGSYYGCAGCTYNCSTSLALNQTSVSLSVGQSAYVTATANYYGSLYVSSNSNSSVATATASGGSVTIYGQNSGSTSIAICSTGNNACATVYVSVSGACYNGSCGGSGNLSLSQTSVNLAVGQNTTVTGNTYTNYLTNTLYINSNSNPSVATASVIGGNSITIYGQSSGSTTLNICANGAYSNCASIYVTVGGYCTTGSCGIGNLTLSQTSVNLSAGQTSYVTASGNTGALYISNNGNSSVVSATISGNQISLYGLTAGSSTLSICSYNNSACVSLYVVVSGSGSNGALSLSQTSVNLNVGQSTTITANNSFGSTVFVSQNSSPSVVSTFVSGNVVTINALAYGSSNLTICTSYNNNCGTAYIYVNGGSNYYGSLSFSPSSPTLNMGQSLSVSVYNSNGNYSNLYLSNNTNSSVASASVSGTTLNIFGNNPGTTTLTVCTSTGGQCGTLYVTVTGSGSGSNLFLSPSSLNMYIGQTSTVTMSGGYNYNYYISGNSSPTVASATVSGNTLTVSGVNYGFTSFTICSGGSSQCATLSVNVNNSNYGGGTGSLSLSQSSISLAVNQTTYVTAYNYGSGLYISSNSNSGIVTAIVSGNQVSFRGIASGSASVLVCTNNAGQCGTVYVTVSGGGVSYPGGGVLGASAYANGTLINEAGTVSIVYRNTKTAFASAYVFQGLGFSFNNVINVGYSGLANSGYVISTPYAAHPWGSWIKSGSTVYFVDESGLIPVPDWNTFLNNGGQANMIVPANRYDFSLPQLSPLTYSDYRLQ